MSGLGSGAVSQSAVKVWLFMLAVSCTTHGSRPTHFIHETGEKKTAAFSKSKESGFESHKTYTRVSGPGSQSEIPSGPEQPALPEIEKGSAVMQSAGSGAHVEAGQTQASSSFQGSNSQGQSDSLSSAQSNGHGQASSDFQRGGSYSSQDGYSFEARSSSHQQSESSSSKSSSMSSSSISSSVSKSDVSHEQAESQRLKAVDSQTSHLGRTQASDSQTSHLGRAQTSDSQTSHLGRAQTSDSQTSHLGRAQTSDSQTSHLGRAQSSDSQTSHHGRAQASDSHSHLARAQASDSQTSHLGRAQASDSQTSHLGQAQASDSQTSHHGRAQASDSQTSHHGRAQASDSQTSHHGRAQASDSHSHLARAQASDSQTSHLGRAQASDSQTSHLGRAQASDSQTSHLGQAQASDSQTSHLGQAQASDSQTSHLGRAQASDSQTSHLRKSQTSDSQTSHHGRAQANDSQISHHGRAQASDSHSHLARAQASDSQTSHLGQAQASDSQTLHLGRAQASDSQTSHLGRAQASDSQTSHLGRAQASDSQTSYLGRTQASDSQTSHLKQAHTSDSRTSHPGRTHAVNSQNSHLGRDQAVESQTSHLGPTQTVDSQAPDLGRTQTSDSQTSHLGRAQADERSMDDAWRMINAQSRAGADARSSSSSARTATRDNRRSSPMTSESRGMSDLDKVSAIAADIEQQTYFKELFSRRCKDCEVNGQKYRGHSRFEYDEGCNRYRCVCSCDGSYNCPPRYTIDICKEDARAGQAESGDSRRRRCQRCQALGHEFEGNSYFDVQDGCIKYRGCICYCNGTWNCPSERAIDTCARESQAAATTTPSPCRVCNARGKVVTGNTYFELEEPCRRYRNCRCKCDGSWECPDQYTENTCQSTTPQPTVEQHPSCQKCNAKGKEVPGNQYFQLTDGCIEYKNCICRCNGSWTCPAQYANNICANQDGQSVPLTDTTRAPVNSDECQSCFSHGRYFRGNTYFTTRSGCIRYDRCVCRCDGSWDCPSVYATNTCEDDDPNNDSEDVARACSFCDARDKIIPSNSFFNLTEGCVQHTRCLCHCDGAWTCPERFSRNICQASLAQNPEGTCGSCLVGTRVVHGNGYFDRISDCFKYRDCFCKCDGTYECQEDRVENICAYNNTAASSSASSSATSAAESSSSSSATSAAESSAALSSSSSCIRCFAFGQFHSPNSRFLHEQGCLQYDCDCHCNGSYICPPERTRNICQSRCKECELDGQFYEGNTYFKYSRGCIEYLCTCFCNGSYNCPAERANNTCSAVGVVDSSRSTVSDVSSWRDDRCRQCVTNDGISHPPESDFNLEDGCIHYKCRCNCDGSWNCPGEAARNICRGEVLGGCRSCVISEAQIYRGDQDFQMREGCIHYMCRCNCDGSWECPGERARDVCLGEVLGSCRVCRVSENETYRGSTQFQLRQGCYHYQCNCHCNGSWDCPGETARDVCIGEVPGGCRVCKLASGEIYLGESDFQMVKNCVHYNCRCNCDGSWDCPGERARRVCEADGSPLRERPQTTTVQPPARCRRCVVSDAEQFPPSQPFSLMRGCNEYHCHCECDGSWNCPADRVRNVCSRRDNPELRAQTCASCRVSTYTYPGRSTFLLTRGCNQYDCQCDCSGRWTCDHSNVRNICQDDSQAYYSSSRTSSDVYAGSRQSPADAFSSMTSAMSQRQDQRSITSNTGQREVSTTRGSSISTANLGSLVDSQPDRACIPCLVEGQEYPPEREFVLDKTCKRFNCFCSCNGRWRCPRERTVDLCPGDTSAPHSASKTIFPTDGRQAYNSQGQKDGRRTSTAYTQDVAAGEIGQRYGRTDIRVVGANTQASSSSSSRANTEEDRDFRGMNVRGYYVDSARQSYDQQGSHTSSQQTESRPALHQVPQSYGQTEQARGQLDSQRQALYARDNEQNSRRRYQQSQDSNLRSSAEQESQEQRRSSSSQTASAAAAAAAVSSSYDSPASSAASSVVSVAGVESNSQDNRCIPCQVDEKVYQTGAKFDWRRGCVIYKCSCLCSGSYRCRLSVDPECSEEEARAGGLPTGPAAQGPPAYQPGGTCGNCYVHGYVYPGNMSFTLRQGCQELSCRCGCDGSHECSDQKPIQGCTAMSTPLAGAVYPYGLAPAVYPIGAGGYAARPGRIINTFQQTYYSSSGDSGMGCPTCSQGNGILVPVHLAYSGQVPVHQTQVDHMQAGTIVQSVPMQSVEMSDSAEQDSLGDKTCASCFVNGQSHRGSFQYTKDCYQVTCYCDCSGWLRCSVQPAMTAVCPPQYGPVSGRCRSCVVHGHEYPPSLQFALRVGCYGYDCTCGCDGLWMCPTQQPSNYCVRPASPPPGVVEDPLDVLASEATHGQTAEQRDRSYSRTAGLKDFTFSRTAERSEVDPMLTCQHCEVSGTTYPSRTKFFLRDGCMQHTCDCACDGSWACPKSATIDVCQQEQGESNQPLTEEKLEDEAIQEKQRALAELAAYKARMAATTNKECRSCHVNDKVYLTNADFQFQSGCYMLTCRCFCNGSWECPTSKSRNICSQGDYRPDGCRQCHVGNKTYPGRSAFAYREGCWEFNCQCGCNGEANCPAEKSRDLCNAGGSVPAAPTTSPSDVQADRLPSRCKPCMVDGQVIRSRKAFSLQRGCTEFLCHCNCNGTWTCPPERSFNFCDQNDATQHENQNRKSDLSAPRKGCTVGRKTHFTRLFAYNEGCIQHMCICYDSGAWKCPPGKERRIC